MHVLPLAQAALQFLLFALMYISSTSRKMKSYSLAADKNTLQVKQWQKSFPKLVQETEHKMSTQST